MTKMTDTMMTETEMTDTGMTDTGMTDIMMTDTEIQETGMINCTETDMITDTETDIIMTMVEDLGGYGRDRCGREICNCEAKLECDLSKIGGSYGGYSCVIFICTTNCFFCYPDLMAMLAGRGKMMPTIHEINMKICVIILEPA